MPEFKVNVKWGKEKFEGIEVDTSEPPEVFKAQLFALSGVPPERQKIMAKGMALKDDTWGSFKIKNGLTLLMMGSATELPKAPEKKTVFIEDMSEAERATASNLPAGLNNLGNTCYMNATVQCLKNVPELKNALQEYKGHLSLGNIMSNPSEAVTIALRDLFKTMEKTAEGFPPIIFLQVMHSVFPQFAEKNEHGTFQQQDANECWLQIVRMLQQQVKLNSDAPQSSIAESSAQTSLIEKYFGIHMKAALKCTEAPEEEPTESKETQLQLSCFISQDVKFLKTGLSLRLNEKLTKNSPTLGRDAEYTRTSKISRLPSYLTVQFVRFYYKEKEKVNAKILKDVKFPLMLDVFDLCTPELQTKLGPMRDRFKEEEDRLAVTMKANKEAKARGEEMEVDEKDKKSKTMPFSFEDDVGSNNSGYYELTAVLTHRGRSSSSGHYVGWVRKKGDEWIMCDDDNMSPVSSQDILKLSGGGDWHIAYVLLYGPRKLTITEES
ncbi:ubiquitin carboxyl-terminal hydrolase 14-like [Rhopilema esculentum]|uniref:ubiquitin carboxyl-terminal hydrolase 14-like n=1 Tax=Rhopilema esculentum TaxID=499914 RepID=UPI0031DA7D0E